MLGAARLWPLWPGAASATDSKPGRGDVASAPLLHPGEKGVKKNALRPRGRGKYFLLTARTLCGFGRGLYVLIDYSQLRVENPLELPHVFV